MNKMFYLFFLIFPLYIFSANPKMTPAETGEITSGIYAVRDAYVNCYFIKIGSGYIAVDAGIKADAVKNELKRLKINPEEIIALFLTHADHDHCGAISLFNNAEIYLSKEETKMISGEIKRAYTVKNFNFKYKTFSDDEIIKIGSTSVQCIFTPGHTSGSASFLINNEFLFTGDSMSLVENKAELFISFYNMNNKEQEESIKKIAKLKNIKLILTGHFGCSADFDKAFEAWR